MRDLEAQLRKGVVADDERAVAEAAAAVALRADQLRLVDVGYATYDSPLGTLVLAATSRGLVRLAYGDQGVEATLDQLAHRVSPRILELPGRLDQAFRELDEYFTGERSSFGIPLDLRLVRGFGRRVLTAAAAIPYGSVVTYRDVAVRAGSERAVRAAGTALGANPVPIVVPCHRVVRSGGQVGGYTGGSWRKVELLRLEGVTDPAL